MAVCGGAGAANFHFLHDLLQILRTFQTWSTWIATKKRECIPNTNSACNAALTQVMRRQSWGQMPWRTSVVIVKTPKVLNCVPKFLHCNARTNQNTFWFWQGSEETVLGRYLAKQHLLSPPLPIAQPCPHSVHPTTLAPCMAKHLCSQKVTLYPYGRDKKVPNAFATNFTTMQRVSTTSKQALL